jgi:predicted dehydrogenase
MTGKLRVGIIGLGVGRSHAHAFASLPDYYELLALCDIDESRAQMLAEEYNVPIVTTDFDKLLSEPDLDVIDICTPSSLHFKQITDSLSAGKNVICEKPLVGSLNEMDALARAEDISGKFVMPIFQYRYGQGLQKLRFLVDRGLAGNASVSTAETAWRRREFYYATPWRGKWSTEMGGTLVTHAVHQHDLLYYILGPACSVYARAANRVHNIEVEDCASISMEMADGSLVSSSVTVGSSEQISRLRFCFSNLSAESSTQPYSNSSEPWKITPDSPEIAESIAQVLQDFSPLPEGFEGQFLRCAQALDRGEPLPVTLADARASIELLTAIYASILTGEAVKLPITEEHPMYGGWAELMRNASNEDIEL